MSKSYSIPHLYASGTHYEVGYQTGKTFKDRIKQFLDEFFTAESKLVPYIRTDEGKNYLKNQNEIFPWYIDEIKGIAEGSGIPFELLFAINLRVELCHLCNPGECEVIEKDGKECTDLHLVNDSNFLLAHNEDAPPSTYATGYLVTLKINSTDYNGKKAPNEDFTCYCYPGHLPGNAFGFNKNGFVFGMNAVYPKLIALDRTPRQFVNRLVMGAKTLEELENMILNTPISYGVALNVSCCTKDLSLLKTSWNNEYASQPSLTDEIIYPISWSYEIAPNKEVNGKNIVSKHCIIPKNVALQKNLDKTMKYFTMDYLPHYNHYIRISMEECECLSSKHREAREKQLKKPTNKHELLEIASDTGDSMFPIFRNESETDGAKTVATALFDIQNCMLSIYFGKPSGGYDLLVKLGL